MSARISESDDTVRQFVISRPGSPEKVVWVEPYLTQLGPGDNFCTCGCTEVYLVVDGNSDDWKSIEPGTVPGACAKCGYFVE
jgi:hypothetical protein